MKDFVSRKKAAILLLLTTALAVGASFAGPAHGQVTLKEIIGEQEKGDAKADQHPGQVPISTDMHGRDTPRTSVKEFFRAARKGDYERASRYLDLGDLPEELAEERGAKLARQFKVVLDRTLWVDLDLLSPEPQGHTDDGLPADRDFVGRIQTRERSIDVSLQRKPVAEGNYIWQFSSATVARIPELYQQFGYGPLGDWLEGNLPEWEFLGMPAWEWVLIVVFGTIGYLVAFVPTWIAARRARRSESGIVRQIGKLITGPVRLLLALAILRYLTRLLPLSVTARAIMDVKTGPLLILVWAGFLLTNLLTDVAGERLQKKGSGAARVLLPPTRAGVKILIVLVACVVWLENVGFQVSTLLAGLGVGGLAVALAAQDVLKNFLGSIMILLDKPYSVGQRINVKGHDGTVEEIGIRSTKLRLLTGRQVTIPNEEMAKIDIENVTRRNYIKRVSELGITYGTPPEKVEKALEILRGILDNHEGMDPNRPPRVYFTEFNPSALNIRMTYWYHPARLWDFYAHSEAVNLSILRAFNEAGIQFAFPSTTTYLAQSGPEAFRVALVEGIDAETRTVESPTTPFEP